MRIDWPAIPLSWRDNVRELVIVAVGVVLGIAATEGVRAWTDAAEIRAIREALNEELSGGYYAWELRERMNPCIARRARELNAWLDIPPDRRRKLPDYIGLPLSILVYDTVWQVASSNGSVTKMTVRDLLGYSRLYGSHNAFVSNREREMEIWYDIIEFGGRRMIDEREASLLRVRVGGAMRIQAVFSSNRTLPVAELARLGIRTDPLDRLLARATLKIAASPICQPLFPA